MSEPMIHVTRGPLTESIHRGDAVVVNKYGQILASIGDPFKTTYIRSAGKPLQTLNVVVSGAADHFGFTDAEIAIMCASHYGEPFHRETILSILKKMDQPLEALQCGSTLSIKAEYAKELIASHFDLKPYNNDCSGKHSGMLATCLMKHYPLEGYTLIDHSVEQDILATIAHMCQIPAEEIALGVDGCSVPVHGMPLYNMALGFARLADPAELEEPLQMACRRVYDAMNAAPEMVAGTDGFCTELMHHTNGKLIGKLGAEAIYCIGVRDGGLGIAVKIEDGNYERALNPSVMRILEDLNILTDAELKALESFREPPVKNNLGALVGTVTPIFHLNT